MNTILITGGSSGFGLETARYFLDREWSVTATMRAPRGDLLPASERLRVLALDVTDAASIARAVQEAGPIDALVNNAGAGLMGALEGVSIDATRRLFELNTFGTMAMTRAVLPGFRAQGSGVIVNLSSAVTLKPLPLLSAYTASKAAVEAFSEDLALEVEPFGVRVRLVVPGRAPGTSFSATARARSQNGIPEAYATWAKQVSSAAPRQPVEVTTARDVAEAVWQAVTDASSPLRIPAGADAVTLAAHVVARIPPIRPGWSGQARPSANARSSVMNRRQLLALTSSAAATAALPRIATGDTNMASPSADTTPRTTTGPVRNIVLVHGAFADGSGWRGVHDELTARGYRVSIVQNPLTSFEDDVAATRRVLARQDGSAILVGHSYGGSVITEAGAAANVAGLVYVAAFAPEVGQSTLDQYAEVPPPPDFQPDVQPDGFAFLRSETFRAGFAGDTSEADAAFLRASQVPIAMRALEAKVTVAAWRSRPSWYVVATEDGAIAPELLRSTARRIGATTTEVPGSHVVFLTQPRAVADVIEQAAKGAVAAR